MIIAPNRWGKDHFSLLGYIVTRFEAPLERKRLRCNSERHPLLVGNESQIGDWKKEYGTKLKDSNDKVPDHDDWDCLDDLEAAGLVEIISMVNGIVHLTKKGSNLAFRLLQHKRTGGNFAGFEMPSSEE